MKNLILLFGLCLLLSRCANQHNRLEDSPKIAGPIVEYAKQTPDISIPFYVDTTLFQKEYVHISFDVWLKIVKQAGDSVMAIKARPLISRDKQIVTFVGKKWNPSGFWLYIIAKHDTMTNSYGTVFACTISPEGTFIDAQQIAFTFHEEEFSILTRAKVEPNKVSALPTLVRGMRPGDTYQDISTISDGLIQDRYEYIYVYEIKDDGNFQIVN